MNYSAQVPTQITLLLAVKMHQNSTSLNVLKKIQMVASTLLRRLNPKGVNLLGTWMESRSIVMIARNLLQIMRMIVFVISWLCTALRLVKLNGRCDRILLHGTK